MPSSSMSCSRSSCGSESLFSCDNRCPFTKVPLDDLTSRIHILPLRSAQTSACCRDRTLESKYPLRGVGIVLLLVCRPMRRTSGKKGTVMVLRSKVPFMGIRCRMAVLSPACRCTPFCCDCRMPFCCDGNMADGACRALMAEAADAPGPAVATCWGRAMERPATGSVLVAG
jgi:hypothetical protein